MRTLATSELNCISGARHVNDGPYENKAKTPECPPGTKLDNITITNTPSSTNAEVGFPSGFTLQYVSAMTSVSVTCSPLGGANKNNDLNSPKNVKKKQ